MTIIMASNVDHMINMFGLLNFFNLFKNWVLYGFIFVLIMILIYNFGIIRLKNILKKTQIEIADLQHKLNSLLKKDKQRSDEKEKSA
jgi:hypothetical protein